MGRLQDGETVKKRVICVVAVFLVIAQCMWMARPKATEERIEPTTVYEPVKVYIPNNENVRICENGNRYCDEVPLSDGWQAFTQDTCKRYGIDYSLMLGLMETESSFREDADSGWAYGLCQIGYINEEDLAEKGMDIYTNAGNIEASCVILSDLLSRHDVSEALMAYNMGEYGASEYWDEGITESQYSRDVLAAARRWEEVLR